MQSWEVEFGHLRSIMSQFDTMYGKSEFWRWLERAYTRYPNQYKTQAVPYIQRHTEGVAIRKNVSGWSTFEAMALIRPNELRHVTLYDERPQLTSTALKQIAQLSIIRTPFDPEHFEQLLTCAHFDNLYSLTIKDQGLTTEHLQHFQVATLPALEHLDLSGHPFNPDDLQSLQTLTDLKVLKLNRCEIADDAVPTLTQFGHLQELELEGNDLGFESICTLNAHPNLMHTTLHLNHNRLNGRLINQYLNEEWSQLTYINLESHDLCDADIEAFYQSEALAKVIELDLGNNDITGQGIDILLQSPHLQHLEILDLSFTDVTSADVVRILMSETVPKLNTLRLILTAIHPTEPQFDEIERLAEARSVHLDIEIDDDEPDD